MDKYSALKRYFGHSSFRGGQEALVDAILESRDVLGVMPTGGGKSVCYQLPAVMLEGVALIISPLISLMKDQVMALKNTGIGAAYINSSLTPAQIKTVYGRMCAGDYKIVYVAPERLLGEYFISLFLDIKLSLIAVDEAHCISQWGQDFRPSYLKISDFVETLHPRPVVAAFTATATPQVREDIEQALKLRQPLHIVTGFDRPNLHLQVQKPKRKLAMVKMLAEHWGDQSGIIYCATRGMVERVCEVLRASGVAATKYHAGLPDTERRLNQDDFLYDRRPVLVATNAFGMGIDKPNVRYVIHYNMPKSLEGYYQEAGRAGRDGGKSNCVLLFSEGDIATAKFLIQHAGDNSERSVQERQLIIQQDYRRLDRMIGYCRTPDCLRGYLLKYFGQTHGKVCANCGNCCVEYALMDITIQSQMILSCVKRAVDKLGYPVDATRIVRILYGSGERRLKHLGLDTLSTYGLMKTTPRLQIREYINHLESAGYLRRDRKNGGIELTPLSKDVLFRGKSVEMPQKKD